MRLSGFEGKIIWEFLSNEEDFEISWVGRTWLMIILLNK